MKACSLVFIVGIVSHCLHNKKVIFFYFSIKPFFISCVKETIRIHKLNFYYIV